jgi:hypothetical protein
MASVRVQIGNQLHILLHCPLQRGAELGMLRRSAKLSGRKRAKHRSDVVKLGGVDSATNQQG